eukprot:TRINITY_DN6073_c0_g1_i1.p1 TRINITY_DN6073_c0_g1~~TRINITY_DN6073_c0_g1_i1.p1  ORF type:complete len:658 (+),score=166.27 TRINITY_DN6073_c0_g1_i1:48-2021(+)
MGVRTLYSTILKNRLGRIVGLEGNESKKTKILVDGDNFQHYITDKSVTNNRDIDLAIGFNTFTMKAAVDSFFNLCELFHIELVFAFDINPTADQKTATTKDRYCQGFDRFVRSTNPETYNQQNAANSFEGRNVVIECIKQQNTHRLCFCDGESDNILAKMLTEESSDYFGILSGDSDFACFKDCRMLVLSTLEISSEGISCRLVTPDDIKRSFRLNDDSLWLFTAVLGNDFTKNYIVQNYRKLGLKKNPMAKEVATFVRGSTSVDSLCANSKSRQSVFRDKTLRGAFEYSRKWVNLIDVEHTSPSTKVDGTQSEIFSILHEKAMLSHVPHYSMSFLARGWKFICPMFEDCCVKVDQMPKRGTFMVFQPLRLAIQALLGMNNATYSLMYNKVEKKYKFSTEDLTWCKVPTILETQEMTLEEREWLFCDILSGVRSGCDDSKNEEVKNILMTILHGDHSSPITLGMMVLVYLTRQLDHDKVILYEEEFIALLEQLNDCGFGHQPTPKVKHNFEIAPRLFEVDLSNQPTKEKMTWSKDTVEQLQRDCPLSINFKLDDSSSELTTPDTHAIQIKNLFMFLMSEVMEIANYLNLDQFLGLSVYDYFDGHIYAAKLEWPEEEHTVDDLDKVWNVMKALVGYGEIEDGNYCAFSKYGTNPVMEL